LIGLATPDDVPEDLPDEVKNMLSPNEKVELHIKEKIYNPKTNIDPMVVTNERIILRHPHAAGLKKDYTDYSHSDFEGVQLEKGIMRSTIKVKIKGGEEPLELGKLPTHQAENGYGKIREHMGRFQAFFLQDMPTPPKILSNRFSGGADTVTPCVPFGTFCFMLEMSFKTT